MIEKKEWDKEVKRKYLKDFENRNSDLETQIVYCGSDKKDKDHQKAIKFV